MREVLEQELLSLTVNPGGAVRLPTPLEHLRDVRVVQSLHDGVLAVLREDVQVQEPADLVEFHCIFHPIAYVGASLIDQVKVDGVNIERAHKHASRLL